MLNGFEIGKSYYVHCMGLATTYGYNVRIIGKTDNSVTIQEYLPKTEYIINGVRYSVCETIVKTYRRKVHTHNNMCFVYPLKGKKDCYIMTKKGE